MERFKDHFSPLAQGYARYRPGYPAQLFAWLAEAAPGRTLAWDCATGSGQAALGLAPHFDAVVATDASAEQLENAEPHANITYRVAPAEASGIEAGAVDLVTVAQALHWFDLPAFYAEVERVLRPGGMLAVWTYNLLSVSPGIDAVVNPFCDETLADYWPAERRHVQVGYRDLAFPFAEVAAPAFAMTADWTLEQLIGYLRTWSAVRRYREREGEDPVAAVEAALQPLWGEGARRIAWPLTLRAGYRA